MPRPNTRRVERKRSKYASAARPAWAARRTCGRIARHEKARRSSTKRAVAESTCGWPTSDAAAKPRCVGRPVECTGSRPGSAQAWTFPKARMLAIEHCQCADRSQPKNDPENEESEDRSVRSKPARTAIRHERNVSRRRGRIRVSGRPRSVRKLNRQRFSYEVDGIWSLKGWLEGAGT